MIQPRFVIENGPSAPEIQVNDRVVVNIEVGRCIMGYVSERGPDWVRIYNGPQVLIAHVKRFIQRHGQPFTPGTQTLPIDIWG